MTKWLRKYNKILLVVAGVILMVSFLIGPAINQFGPNPAKRTVGYFGPNKARAVTGMDLGLAHLELAAVREFCAPLSRGASGELILQFLDIKDEVHWLLLVEEARRAGFVASQADGQAWVSELAAQAAPMFAREQFLQELDAQNPGIGSLLRQNPQFLAQFNPERQQELLNLWAGGLALSRFQQSRSQIAASARMTNEQFDAAMTKLRGIYRMVSASVEAPTAYSDRRAALVARELGDSANVDYVWISGSRLAASVGQPTPEQLAEHFQQLRETMPGTGEHGLGYLQPPRARLAWLTLDRAVIAAAVEQAEIPAEQLLDRWSRRRLVYPGEFTAEIERVKADVRAERVTEILDLARRSVVQQVHRKTQALSRAGGLYYTLPADWTPPNFEEIAQGVVSEIQSTSGIAVPLPAVTILNGPWQDRTDLQALPGIGQSQMRQGASSVPFAEVVMAVKELSGENPLGMQVNMPHVEQPLEDAQGNIYFLTVLDVRPIGPADSIDEVIDQVRADYIALKGYELLRLQVDSLRQTAADQGLDAVAALFPPEQAAPENGEPAAALTTTRDQFTRSQPNAGFPPPLGDASFCEAVLAAARLLDPRIPATEQPIEARTLAAAVPAGLGVGVAQIVWFAPCTQEQFRGFAASDFQMAQSAMREWQESLSKPDEAPTPELLIGIAMGPFADEPMRQRWNWVEREN